MLPKRLILFALPCLLAIASGFAVAQYGRRFRSMPGTIPDDRNGVPNWTVDERFKHDVFTFVRVQYDSGAVSFPGGGRRGGYGRGWGGGWGWATDYPDSDLNFS